MVRLDTPSFGSETTSEPMSEPKPSSKFQFLQLPAEIRLEIYKIILINAKIELTVGHVVDERLDLIDTLKLIENKKAAIFLTSKLMLHEALPIVAQHTHVVIDGEYDTSSRHDVFAKLAREFLCHVNRITLPQEHFMRTKRSQLSSLRKVILSDLISDTYTLPDFQTVTCACHGGYSAEELSHLYLGSGSDWNWRRNQFLYLAAEGGYEIEANLFARNRKTGLRCEWVFDLETGEFSKRRLLKGFDVLYEGNNEDPGMACKWELYQDALQMELNKSSTLTESRVTV